MGSKLRWDRVTVQARMQRQGVQSVNEGLEVPQGLTTDAPQRQRRKKYACPACQRVFFEDVLATHLRERCLELRHSATLELAEIAAARAFRTPDTPCRCAFCLIPVAERRLVRRHLAGCSAYKGAVARFVMGDASTLSRRAYEILRESLEPAGVVAPEPPRVDSLRRPRADQKEGGVAAKRGPPRAASTFCDSCLSWVKTASIAHHRATGCGRALVRKKRKKAR